MFLTHLDGRIYGTGSTKTASLHEAKSSMREEMSEQFTDEYISDCASDLKTIPATSKMLSSIELGAEYLDELCR